MESLDIKSWEKAGTIYKWNLLLTVIATAFIVPRILPLGSLVHTFNIHIQWRAVLIVPLIYIVFTLAPLVIALAFESIVFLITGKYSGNNVVQICYILWILEVLFVLAGAIDAWLFQYAHHLPVLLH